MALLRCDSRLLATWASNNTGSAWNVDVDTGSGSFTNVGTIPDNGGAWTLYHFTFTTAASGTRYIRVVDNNATGGDLYLDDINIYRSWFEYNVDQSGSDGDVQNGDEFSSALPPRPADLWSLSLRDPR